jgi:DNA ligase-1
MNEKDMQHGRNWNGHKINGYIANEKYNGCHAYWDGFDMWTRGGFKVKLPDSWRTVLPAGVQLDGEVYDGVDGFYRTESAVKYGRFTPSMRFMIFDSPSFPGKYMDRMTHAKKYEAGPLVVVSSWRIKNITDALNYLKEIISCGGEGLILRKPSLKYIPGRTSELLKLKEGFA